MGKDYDATGLIYFNARYYDPTTGRFLTEDPSRKGVNWYAYCGNNPINKVDRTGRQEESLADVNWRPGADIARDPSFPTGPSNAPEINLPSGSRYHPEQDQGEGSWGVWASVPQQAYWDIKGQPNPLVERLYPKEPTFSRNYDPWGDLGRSISKLATNAWALVSSLFNRPDASGPTPSRSPGPSVPASNVSPENRQGGPGNNAPSGAAVARELVPLGLQQPQSKVIRR